jgi:hypothetical protein
METTSFVLGMLSIIAVGFMAVIVWGIVKINKLTFQMKATHEWIDNNTRDRDYNFEQVYNQIAECRSYTDSRIDKVLSTKSTKQVIKG